MAQAIRAPKGGCVGINGEFYFGGEFLPTTNHAKGILGKERKKVQGFVGRKRELRPYHWVPITQEVVDYFESQLAENEFIKILDGAMSIDGECHEGQTWRACVWGVNAAGKKDFVRNIVTDKFNY